MHRSWVLGIAIVLTSALAACNGASSETSHAPTSSTRPTTTSTVRSSTTSLPSQTTSAPVPIGTHAVGVRTERYVDATRSTPSNGDAPGSPTRVMEATVWYPATGDASSTAVPDAPADTTSGRFPLVVFAHGFDVTPSTYAELLGRWASAGYVVVAPAIPLLSHDAPGGASHADYGAPNIADVGFAVREAIRRADTPGDLLSGLADPARVAVAGHSDGEVLAYANALEACCHDDRVGAAVLLAGNLANAKALPARTDIPVLHVVADLDEYNPFAESVEFDRAHLPPSSYLLTLHDAHHLPPFRDPADPHFDLVARVSVDFLDLALKSAADGQNRMQSDAGSGALATLEPLSGAHS